MRGRWSSSCLSLALLLTIVAVARSELAKTSLFDEAQRSVFPAVGTTSSYLLPHLSTNAAPPVSEIRVLIGYHSGTGWTAALAQHVAAGAKTVATANVVLKRVGNITCNDLLWLDALILGSPVFFAAPAAEVKEFIDRIQLKCFEWPINQLTGVCCAVLQLAASCTDCWKLQTKLALPSRRAGTRRAAKT